MDKKGALELSINAIVILIIAITMLGLGLGFVRGMFGKASGQFEELTGAEVPVDTVTESPHGKATGVLVRNWKSKSLKKVFYLFTSLFVLLIAFSRIVMGVHWFSDVFAGLVFGIFWFSLCILIYSNWQ